MLSAHTDGYGSHPSQRPPLAPHLLVSRQGQITNYTNQSAAATNIVSVPPSHNGNLEGDIKSVSENASYYVQNGIASTRTVGLTQFWQHTNVEIATCLFIESDSTFLDPVHNFLRCRCIELFVVNQNHMMGPVRGACPSRLGQVGLRCFFCKDAPRQELAKQAVSFPTKLETIFESIRNYQRSHLNACPCIPEQVKAEYKILLEQESPLTKPVKYVKAYYAEAASELGLIDGPNGLIFGAPANMTGVPSERLRALIEAVESPFTRALFWKSYSSASARASVSGNDEAIKMKKFEHVASDITKSVIINARKEPSPFVYPQDFALIPDVDFLLFHQVIPCRPSVDTLERRELDDAQYKSLSALCCKHCARDYGVNTRDSRQKGIYFPTTLASLADSSFSPTLLRHLMGCPHVPQQIKDAFDELKRLAVDYGVKTKRGTRRKFLEKIWTRMETHYNK